LAPSASIIKHPYSHPFTSPSGRTLLNLSPQGSALP